KTLLEVSTWIGEYLNQSHATHAGKIRCGSHSGAGATDLFHGPAGQLKVFSVLFPKARQGGELWEGGVIIGTFIHTDKRIIEADPGSLKGDALINLINEGVVSNFHFLF